LKISIENPYKCNKRTIKINFKEIQPFLGSPDHKKGFRSILALEPSLPARKIKILKKKFENPKTFMKRTIVPNVMEI